MGRLSGKVCLVTGGGSGIGRATCELFMREGARVAVMDRNGETAEETQRSAERFGAEAIAIRADIGSTPDVDRMIDETMDKWGRLDVLVNNSGYGIPGSVPETSEEDWTALMNVNVTGIFRACRRAIPIMAAAGGGVIVNVASVVASVGITNRAAYCASKGAVAALTRAMALDHVGQKIRVNAVAPGTIHSPFFDDMLAKSDNPQQLLAGLESRQAMKRLGKPDEIAHGILYLASDESAFCTGTILTIDGGMTAQ